jgi:hypothetical protein
MNASVSAILSESMALPPSPAPMSSAGKAKHEGRMSTRASRVVPGHLLLFDEEELAALECQASRPCPVYRSTMTFRRVRLHGRDER